MPITIALREIITLIDPTTTRPMSFRRAAMLAVEALRAEIARVQIDADLHDRSPIVELGMAQDFRTTRTAHASRRRRDLLQAIETLEELAKVRIE